VDTAVVLQNAGAERIEVKRLEGRSGSDLVEIMRDEELAVDEVNVGFNVAEAMIEGVKEGSGVKIIVVGMRVGKDRYRGFGAARHRGRVEPQAQEDPGSGEHGAARVES
jgi:hypothetical protein